MLRRVDEMADVRKLRSFTTLLMTTCQPPYRLQGDDKVAAWRFRINLWGLGSHDGSSATYFKKIGVCDLMGRCDLSACMVDG